MLFSKISLMSNNDRHYQMDHCPRISNIHKQEIGYYFYILDHQLVISLNYKRQHCSLSSKWTNYKARSVIK